MSMDKQTAVYTDKLALLVKEKEAVDKALAEKER